jgi:amidophosphoribosyltransferase
VCEALGSDGLICQRLDDLIATAKSFNPSIENFDASCFDGKYVTGDVDEAYLQRLEANPPAYMTARR